MKQLALGLAADLKKPAAKPLQIKRCIAMSRVEIFVPAELPEIPGFLSAAFEHKFIDMEADRVETMSIYGLDLCRGLSQCEEEALIDAWFHCGVYSRVFTR